MSEAPDNGDGHSSDEKFRSGGSGAVELTQRVHAPRDVIWSACATARGLEGWQADQVQGDVETGQSIVLGWPALGASLVLDVIRVEAPHRVVLRNGDAEVEISIGEGRVDLVHSGFADADDRAGLFASWTVALALLAHFCERHPNRARSVHWLIGPTSCSASAAHTFFTDAGALTSWLTRRGSLPKAGEPHALELASGATLSGRVLANVPGRDVAISWDEDEASALCLRTLPAASEDERLVALTWSRWTEALPPPERLEEIEAAHARLLRALDRRLWI